MHGDAAAQVNLNEKEIPIIMNNGQQMQRRDERPASPQKRFQDLLTSERVKNQIALALPQTGMTPERLLRIVLTAINRTPLLLSCTETSVLSAVIQSAQLGLEPDGVMGLAYLVPYGNQCQFIVGYRGLIELARRSGLVKNVDAQVVHIGDYFKYRLGLEPTLEHIPGDMLEFEADELRRQALKALGGTNLSSIVAAYCVVTMTDNSKIFRVVGKQYVDKVRKASRGSDNASSPWKQWEEQMWMKTSIKQGLKLIPLSPDDKLLKAMAVDESVMKGMTDVGAILSEMPEPVVDPNENQQLSAGNQGATSEQSQPAAQPAQAPAPAPKRAARAPAAAAAPAQPPAANPKQPPLPGFGDDAIDTTGQAVQHPAQTAADNFVQQAQQGAGASAEPPPGPPPPVDDSQAQPTQNQGEGEHVWPSDTKPKRQPRGQ